MTANRCHQRLGLWAILPLLVGCHAPMMMHETSPLAAGEHRYLGPPKSEIGAGPEGAAMAVVDHVAPIQPDPIPERVPRELTKVTLPQYTVGPPDVLIIEAVKTVPREPYEVQRLDQLQIQADGVLEDRPVQGTYIVGPNGSVDLGPPYGSVEVAGLTTDEAQAKIQDALAEILANPIVTLSLAAPSAIQDVSGEHLVGPDGTVNLGTYGRVFVSGLTIAQIKAAVEEQLSENLEDPEVSVRVFSFNSKSYYVIFEALGQGDSITRTPITGNETVLDAIADQNGLLPTSDRTRIWIARPSPDKTGDQTLPVDYQAIVTRGDTSTNYQLLPGDRLYISEDPMSALDGMLGRLITPFERIFGFTLLGSQTVQTLNRFPLGVNNNQLF